MDDVDLGLLAADIGVLESESPWDFQWCMLKFKRFIVTKVHFPFF